MFQGLGEEFRYWFRGACTHEPALRCSFTAVVQAAPAPGPHPSGLPWLLAVPLIPWTIMLAALVVGDGALLGFSRPVLAMWIAWDASLAWLLFQAARHPRRDRLFTLAGADEIDASLSISHLGRVGLGDSTSASILRLVATLAPILGTVALGWAASRAPPPDDR